VANHAVGAGACEGTPAVASQCAPTGAGGAPGIGVAYIGAGAGPDDQTGGTPHAVGAGGAAYGVPKAGICVGAGAGAGAVGGGVAPANAPKLAQLLPLAWAAGGGGGAGYAGTGALRGALEAGGGASGGGVALVAPPVLGRASGLAGDVVLWGCSRPPLPTHVAPRAPVSRRAPSHPSIALRSYRGQRLCRVAMPPLLRVLGAHVLGASRFVRRQWQTVARGVPARHPYCPRRLSRPCASAAPGRRGVSIAARRRAESSWNAAARMARTWLPPAARWVTSLSVKIACEIDLTRWLRLRLCHTVARSPSDARQGRRHEQLTVPGGQDRTKARRIARRQMWS